jgi:hypothetical protein
VSPATVRFCCLALVSWWRAIDILNDGANRSHLARGYFLFLFSLMSTAQERISRVTDRFMTHWFNFKEQRLCSLSNLKLITLLGNFLAMGTLISSQSSQSEGHSHSWRDHDEGPPLTPESLSSPILPLQLTSSVERNMEIIHKNPILCLKLKKGFTKKVRRMVAFVPFSCLPSQ